VHDYRAAAQDGCPICGAPFPCLRHGGSHAPTRGTRLMRTSRSRIIAAVLAAAATLAVLAGCSAKGTEPFKDAPRSGTDNGNPADLIRMPDGFSNAATKCDHGNRLYIAYHGDSAYAAIAVVPGDPSCQGGTR